MFRDSLDFRPITRRYIANKNVVGIYFQPSSEVTFRGNIIEERSVFSDLHFRSCYFPRNREIISIKSSSKKFVSNAMIRLSTLLNQQEKYFAFIRTQQTGTLRIKYNNPHELQMFNYRFIHRRYIIQLHYHFYS